MKMLLREKKTEVFVLIKNENNNGLNISFVKK